MTRKHWSALVGVACTVFFLWLALRNVEFSEVKAVLAQARWGYFPVMVAICLSDFALRAARWRLLLPGGGPFWLLYQLTGIGLAVNNVLFMRLGELTRAFLASRELGIPLASVLASVVVERALDVAALLTLFNISAAALPGLVGPQLRGAALLALAGAVGALLLLVAAEKPLLPGGSWERRLRPWPKLHRLVEELAMGAKALRDPAAAARAVALSLLLWVMDACFYWTAAWSIGLGGIIDYPRSILILSWGGASSALPAAPGAIGTFEAMVKSIVQTLGATAPQALGYAVYCHILMYLLVTTIGMVFLYRVGLSVAGLQEALEKK